MTTQRDDLAREIQRTQELGCGCCADFDYTREQDQHAEKLVVDVRALQIADHLIAAGYTRPKESPNA